ncbi:MAG TPA: hypothetical protein PKI01_08005 [Bacteroidales bacterium]|nr:hypothetical protein [Bacteroidales bacterium]
MIRHLPYNDIDKAKWDACIGKSVNGNIYAYSWYLDSACERWDALVEDDYHSVMPLPCRKKAGFQYIFPPSLVQQLGIFSVEEISASKVAEFIHEIPSKFKYAEINLNHHNPVEKLTATIKTHVNLELGLNKAYDELQRNYAENLRRTLKKIPENIFIVKKEGDTQELIELFKNNQAKKIALLPKDFYQVLERVSNVAKEKKMMQLWQVFHEGKHCAGVLFIFGFQKAIFLFSANNDTGKELHTMHFLIDRFIRENSGKELTLDFEGSDNKSLARFYRSFGATEKNYNGITLSRWPQFVINSIKSVLKIKNKLL